MTKGSQQSGKQLTSNTAKSTHPPVDNRFFTKKGNPSWPQNGHCGVNGILLTPFTCRFRMKIKSSEHYQSEAVSVNGSNHGGGNPHLDSTFCAVLTAPHSALSICALCNLSE
jgi:hypothetical protein